MTDFPEWSGGDAPDLDNLPQLSVLEAFDAMRLFIEAYWERGLKGSDDLKMLLTAIDRDARMWPDGGVADPAQWHDWLEAVERVKVGEASS